MLRCTHVFVGLVMLVLVGQTRAEDVSPAPAAAPPLEQRVAWWREARFGMFVHWGPVSIKGTDISWTRAGERRDRHETVKEGIPAAEYDHLYEQFNPTQFNARDWVGIAKAAGMKYIVLTAKHHDGFSLWDTKQGDYSIMHTPFGRDVCAELAAACKEGGIRLGFYYSPPDWHHPDFMTANHRRYLTYMHNQVRELLTSYGPIGVLWFDADGGENTPSTWDTPALIPMVRQLQPQVLLTKRAAGEGDFDTPEQHVGAFQDSAPWESCVTLGTQWSWKPDDTIKSLPDCLAMLVRCAGGDGNLLLNVGPMPDGRIEPRQAEQLREMGAWLQQYGNSIYGTRGGPWKPGHGIAATRKGNTVFVHVLRWMNETIELPPISARIVSGSVLTGGSVRVTQTDKAVVLSVASGQRSPIDTIIQLELDAPATSVPVVAWPARYHATASNYYHDSPEYSADKACDGDPESRWATDDGVRQAWLALDLGKVQTIDAINITEAFAGRVTRFELQWRDGDAWKTFLAGTGLGQSYRQTFAPITAREIRLNILDSKQPPTIYEVEPHIVAKP